MNIAEILGLSTFTGFIFLVLTSILSEDLIKTIKVIMSKKITITVLWVINLIVFMLLLWLGEWAIHCGLTWIKNPLHISLASCTITKIFLTGLMFITWWGNDK
jgi:hypothetical protein